MRRIPGLPAHLLGSAIVLLLAGGCSQGEGERCQIASDCASGLVCSGGETGNGRCQSPNSTAGTSEDAAAKLDVASSSGSDVGPQADVAPAVDAGSAIDAGPAVDIAPASDLAPAIDSEPAVDIGSTVVLDAGVSVDTDTIDSP